MIALPNVDVVLSLDRVAGSEEPGGRIASYRCINQVDEVAAAHSLCPGPPGSDRLYCGLARGEVRLFNLSRPGTQSQVTWLHTVRARQGSIIKSISAAGPAYSALCPCAGPVWRRAGGPGWDHQLPGRLPRSSGLGGWQLRPHRWRVQRGGGAAVCSAGPAGEDRQEADWDCRHQARQLKERVMSTAADWRLCRAE